MGHIIAGRFGTKIDADATAQTLHGFIDPHDICIFHNNPPGQHGTTMFGDGHAEHQAAAVAKAAHSAHASGESEQLAQLDKAEDTALTTAAVAGVAAGALAVAAGPVVALAAAGVAAYTGSLAGALGGADDGSHHAPAMRQGGVILAVHIADPAHQALVVQALHTAHAADIEHAVGEWRDGDWTDFDPLAAPKLVAIEKPHSH